MIRKKHSDDLKSNTTILRFFQSFADSSALAIVGWVLSELIDRAVNHNRKNTMEPRLPKEPTSYGDSLFRGWK
jgi:hypothetical protein